MSVRTNDAHKGGGGSWSTGVIEVCMPTGAWSSTAGECQWAGARLDNPIQHAHMHNRTHRHTHVRAHAHPTAVINGPLMACPPPPSHAHTHLDVAARPQPLQPLSLIVKQHSHTCGTMCARACLTHTHTHTHTQGHRFVQAAQN